MNVDKEPQEPRPPRRTRSDPRGDPRARLTVTTDLPGVLVLLLIGAGVLIVGTVAYGFFTHTLDPAIVLGVASTLFTGLLGGALTARRVAHGPARGDTDDNGGGP